MGIMKSKTKMSKVGDGLSEKEKDNQGLSLIESYWSLHE
jgi:hypothetical protein